MTTFFTADFHFNHFNVIGHNKRPFKRVEEMNERLIENHNSRVKPEDECYILGDMYFKTTTDDVVPLIKRLNGTKYLIRGNHDAYSKDPSVRENFVWIRDYFELKHDSMPDRRIIMFHYPLARWNNQDRGAVHLYGHVHNDFALNLPNAYNVGVDVNNYKPISLEEIMVKLTGTKNIF